MGASAVSRFLRYTHGSRILTVNLCEREAYDAQLLPGQYIHSPIIFSKAVPTLEQLKSIAVKCAKWLATDAQNAVAVHCVDG